MTVDRQLLRAVVPPVLALGLVALLTRPLPATDAPVVPAHPCASPCVPGAPPAPPSGRTP
ncbi:MAG: hypothetical protein GC157_07515 [Frankiales bacterium]|nr:hypothetical protein [Frankiales bacterium]